MFALNVPVEDPVVIDPVVNPFHFFELSASKHVAALRFETRVALDIVIDPTTSKAGAEVDDSTCNAAPDVPPCLRKKPPKPLPIELFALP
ncbi:hypothetical protein W03_10030 [Nitrosomonas sp. PY1]|nr:hypothetical protein W03_10030 [Nitrosomonas sp. PY1]